MLFPLAFSLLLLAWYCGTLECAVSPIRNHAGWLGPVAGLAGALLLFYEVVRMSTRGL